MTLVWNTARFEFRFRDPETQQPQVEVHEIHYRPGEDPQQVAEDVGYGLADKGPCTIKKLEPR